MSVIINWPTTEHTTEVTDKIRGAIGRDVLFYIVASSAPCPAPGCGPDPVTNTALDSYCLVCSGLGYLYTYSGVSISGHITWGYSERMGWETGGQLDEGDCRVQVKYTIANENTVDNTKWAIVDNRKMQIIKKLLRGVPVINRILIDLIEIERE